MDETAEKKGRPSTTRNEERPAKKQKEPSNTRNGDADDEPDEISEVQPQTRKYVQLVPRTRRIAQEKLDTWPQVSPQVLDQMVGMLRDAKKDIVNTQRDERRAMLADETLEALVRKLTRQLSSSKIPPQAKEMHFNIDKLTERYAQVFREVTTERHRKQLLKEQIKVAQHLLAKDQENLQQLEKNAKHWKAEWKHQEKHGRFHPLLEELDSIEAKGDGPEDIGLTAFKPTVNVRAAKLDVPGSNFADAELAQLVEQLRRNLESMQGNHEQIAGIDDAMQRAQVALDDVLFRHADARQYAALHV
ncbi:hypothetical protein DM02DRAFT_618695 [Periconia macrospinosa]|uniref:CENP-Q, a CENPA-CAD centromere complex subunit-domain-containing protein n=1 Tax=Periconia macrospinosa TaxID=97972 RepID=A0A2V1D8H1_9PLEO|nr:hypothetical protein DM02DRAFT_618695 [Periconia macrospinosa]